MRNKIKMFATANDTDQFVVAVDGYIQLFPTAAEAEACYAMINPGPGHFDNSGYGSCDFLVPGHRPINRLAKQLGEKEDMTQCLVSEVQPIDLIGYLSKHNKRFDVAFALREVRERQAKPAQQRLAEKRERNAVWGEVFGYA